MAESEESCACLCFVLVSLWAAANSRTYTALCMLTSLKPKLQKITCALYNHFHLIGHLHISASHGALWERKTVLSTNFQNKPGAQGRILTIPGSELIYSIALSPLISLKLDQLIKVAKTPISSLKTIYSFSFRRNVVLLRYCDW